MASKDVYLETTALIDAIFKSFPDVLSIIKSADKIYTSHYAKMEIKRGFLSNLVLLHNRLVQSATITEVHQYIENLAQTPHKYLLGTILATMTVYHKHVEDQRPSDLIAKYGNISHAVIIKREVEGSVRNWIRILLSKIDRSVDEVLNPMGCFQDLKAPEMKGPLFTNSPSKCNESPVKCEIKKYFGENEELFTKILAKLNKIAEKERDGETSKRIQSLKKILKLLPYSMRKFSNHDQNHDLCWACGDALHAVLSPSTADVVNRNSKHFDIICAAINKQSETYTSPK